MNRFVVTARLQPDAASKVAEVLREGPPFDLQQTAFERHEVFLADDELVLLFEGPEAEREVRRLLAEPRVLERAGRIGVHLRGPPKLPREVFGWERPIELEGLTFGPDPGPGDSDGGGS